MNIDTKPKQGSVVVGADGSPGGDAAVERAVRHATARRRPLTLVTATGDPGASAEILGSAEARRVLQLKARRASEHALGVVDRIAPGLDIDVRLPLQDPRQALIDISDHASVVVSTHLPDASPVAGLVERSETAAALVVGSRGRSGVKSLVGSVGRSLNEHAHCTVVVVRP